MSWDKKERVRKNGKERKRSTNTRSSKINMCDKEYNQWTKKANKKKRIEE